MAFQWNLKGVRECGFRRPSLLRPKSDVNNVVGREWRCPFLIAVSVGVKRTILRMVQGKLTGAWINAVAREALAV